MCDNKDKKTVEPTLEPMLQAHIGKQLREMYGATAREPVPDDSSCCWTSSRRAKT